MSNDSTQDCFNAIRDLLLEVQHKLAPQMMPHPDGSLDQLLTDCAVSALVAFKFSLRVDDNLIDACALLKVAVNYLTDGKLEECREATLQAAHKLGH